MWAVHWGMIIIRSDGIFGSPNSNAIESPARGVTFGLFVCLALVRTFPRIFAVNWERMFWHVRKWSYITDRIRFELTCGRTGEFTACLFDSSITWNEPYYLRVFRDSDRESD